MIAEVVRRKSRGETYTKMSKDLGVSRKTIYNLRSGDAYLTVVDEIFSSLMEEIEELSQSESHTVKIDALKEKGRILRALLPSLSVIQHRSDPEQTQIEKAIDVTEKRRRNEKLINALGLTKKQMRILEENVESEYEPE